MPRGRPLTVQERIWRDMPEKDVQAAVRNAAVRFGWAYSHQHQTRREVVDRRTGHSKWVGDRDFRGFPDTVLARPAETKVYTDGSSFVRRGATIFVECKTELGGFKPGQEEWLHLLGATPGCTSYVVRPSTLDAFIEILGRRPGGRPPDVLVPR